MHFFDHKLRRRRYDEQHGKLPMVFLIEPPSWKSCRRSENARNEKIGIVSVSFRVGALLLPVAEWVFPKWQGMGPQVILPVVDTRAWRLGREYFLLWRLVQGESVLRESVVRDSVVRDSVGRDPVVRGLVVRPWPVQNINTTTIRMWGICAYSGQELRS